jgi:hypothetical protein
VARSSGEGRLIVHGKCPDGPAMTQGSPLVKVWFSGRQSAVHSGRKNSCPYAGRLRSLVVNPLGYLPRIDVQSLKDTGLHWFAGFNNGTSRRSKMPPDSFSCC